jgi:hypothetical protein
MLVVITILTSLTTIQVYAGGDDDGNKNKAEEDSAAAIADCDKNDVEEARFLCIAIAASEIETPEEEPPEEEPPEEEPPEQGLAVCKVVEDPNQEVVPFDFRFNMRSESFSGIVQFQGLPPPDCTQEIFFIVGEYSITEDLVGSVAPPPDRVEIEGDCIQDPNDPQRATGEIQEGETERCTFTNIYESQD